VRRGLSFWHCEGGGMNWRQPWCACGMGWRFGDMWPFSEAFLDGYLDLEGERVMTSVGAYRLEGPGVQLFDRVEGEHSAILGLPLLPLLGFLRQVGVLAE
jgi:hypothetical protein